MARKESSSHLSTIAAEVLAATDESKPLPDIMWLVDRARSLAASVLSQDETKGQDR